MSATRPLGAPTGSTCPSCGAKLPAGASLGASSICRRCGAELPDDASFAAPNPRDRFREVVVVRPQLTAQRGQVKGSRTWPLLVGLVLVALAIAALTLR